LAVVSQTNHDVEHLHEPTVKVISDGGGVPLATPVTVDLAVDGRVIIKTTEAQKYGIRVSDYLI
jgi:predicted S18 family serine protease